MFQNATLVSISIERCSHPSISSLFFIIFQQAPRPPTPRPLRHETRGRGTETTTRQEDGERRRRLGREDRPGMGAGETGDLLADRRKKMLGSEGLRNLSQYYSCSEEPQPSSPNQRAVSSPPARKPPPIKPSPLTQGRPIVSPLGASHPRSPPLSPLSKTSKTYPRTPPVSPLSASHPRSPPLSPLRSQPRSPPLSPLALRRPQMSEDDPYYSACESLDEEEGR